MGGVKMGKLTRHEKEKFTLGIEEEFQIIDPVTREQSPRNPEIIKLAITQFPAG